MYHARELALELFYHNISFHIYQFTALFWNNPVLILDRSSYCMCV